MKKSSPRKSIHAARKPRKPPVVFPRACRLLQGLNDEWFSRICECMNVRELQLKNKQVFITESDPCDRIGIVVSGAERCG